MRINLKRPNHKYPSCHPVGTHLKVSCDHQALCSLDGVRVPVFEIWPVTVMHVETYLVTYSMVQSPSWEANWFEASQIPRISRNPKVHYRTHKRLPPVSILGQPNTVNKPTSHLLEIHPYIIHPSTPRSPQWSPSLWFPHQEPIHALSSPIRATCPAISFLSILSTAQYWVRGTDNLDPRYSVSSIPPLPRPS